MSEGRGVATEQQQKQQRERLASTGRNSSACSISRIGSDHSLGRLNFCLAALLVLNVVAWVGFSRQLMMLSHPAVPLGDAPFLKEHPRAIDSPSIRHASARKATATTTTTSSFPHDFEHALDAVAPYFWNASDVRAYHREHGVGDLYNDRLIYFITPTVKVPTQMLDLTRLGQTLMHDRGIYWIVVEDGDECTQRIRKLLERIGLPFAHEAVRTPDELYLLRQEETPRGVLQRNRGLELTEVIGMPGVVYFGDDDNAYDVRLFEQLRLTQKLGVFSVGFVGYGAYERCVVDKETGKVSYIASNWVENRTFPMDMAGFSYHTSILWEKQPRFRNDWPHGFLETNFVEQMLHSVDQLEPLNHNCTHVYAWHVKSYGRNTTVRVDADEEFSKLQILL